MKELKRNNRNIFSRTFRGILCVAAFLVFILFFDVNFWPAVFATLILWGILLVFTGKGKAPKVTKQKTVISEDLQHLTHSKEEFYKEAGMSKEETHFFRETMNAAKNQILALEKNMNQVAKLKAIEARNNTAQLAKALFKDIVNEPRRLHEVDKFLYSHLPSLVDLTEKYIEIGNHEVKSKTTFEMLDKSATTIDEMCQLIAVDYASFKAEDLEDMDIEIELAKQAIARDNEEKKEIENEEF